MKTYWFITILAVTGLHGQPPKCNVDVYLIIGFPMQSGMLLRARLQAEAMFHEIGVNLRARWGVPKHDPSDTCGTPIRLQFDATAPSGVPADALAYALPYKDSGTCIHVFVGRVLSESEQVLAEAILAHVMVHEITHVLERMTLHSGHGVMKAHWNRQDYVGMHHHSLPFAPEDVQLIHEGLTNRLTRRAELSGRGLKSTDTANVAVANRR